MTLRSSQLLCVLGLLFALLTSACKDPTRAAKIDPKPSAATQTTPARPMPRTVTILTYNVLADQVGEPHRSSALLDLVGQRDADIVALQEVAPWFLEKLRADTTITSRYSYPATIPRFAPGGLLLLSKLPVEGARLEPLPSSQGRAVLYASVKLGEGPAEILELAIVHLESPLESHKERVAQLQMIGERLQESEQAMILGDLNFGTGEQPETRSTPAGFVDIWQQLHPQDPGLTWNMEKSWMAKEGAFVGESSRRLDRILLKAPGWTAKQIEIIGDRPMSQEFKPGKPGFPSDHFGLRATISYNISQP